ncbi:MAG: hypothetical protein ILA06_04420 [Bacteroidaceae bacterium]|nr:hypothetical protein [Bacteroidaceae bacterium]
MKAMTDNNSTHDKALRMALQREQSRIKQPDGMTERLMAAVREQAEASRADKEESKHSLIARWWPMAAAAAVVAAVLILLPRLTERQKLARYEGSYVEVGGQRLDNLHAIRADIREALAMADIAEAGIPKADVAQEAEQEIMQAADDTELQNLLERMLNE